MKIQLSKVCYGLPMKSFFMDYTVSKKRELPVVKEFVIRLIYSLSSTSLDTIQDYFGLTSKEMLAIIDDLGAILIIALFYVGDFSATYFGLAMAIYVLLLVFNRMGITRLWFYFIPGIFMWYFMLRSGVHATLAGVLLAFAIPFGNGDKHSPSYHLQHALHKPVAFIIMPIFALANTGIILSGNWFSGLGSDNSLGIMSGLLLGKPIGVVLMTWLAVAFGISKLPPSIQWRHIIGTGFLAGIGFTMSIFITLLAFDNAATVQMSKITVLLTSLLAGVIGFLILRSTPKVAEEVIEEG